MTISDWIKSYEGNKQDGNEKYASKSLLESTVSQRCKDFSMEVLLIVELTLFGLGKAADRRGARVANSAIVTIVSELFSFLFGLLCALQ